MSEEKREKIKKQKNAETEKNRKKTLEKETEKGK